MPPAILARFAWIEKDPTVYLAMWVLKNPTSFCCWSLRVNVIVLSTGPLEATDIQPSVQQNVLPRPRFLYLVAATIVPL
jgi:hypothetical protein